VSGKRCHPQSVTRHGWGGAAGREFQTTALKTLKSLVMPTTVFVIRKTTTDRVSTELKCRLSAGHGRNRQAVVATPPIHHSVEFLERCIVRDKQTDVLQSLMGPAGADGNIKSAICFRSCCTQRPP